MIKLKVTKNSDTFSEKAQEVGKLARLPPSIFGVKVTERN